VAAAAREDGVALDPEAMIARIESVPPRGPLVDAEGSRGRQADETASV
jgi:hypothetical protein